MIRLGSRKKNIKQSLNLWALGNRMQLFPLLATRFGSKSCKMVVHINNQDKNCSFPNPNFASEACFLVKPHKRKLANVFATTFSISASHLHDCRKNPSFLTVEKDPQQML